MGEIDAPGCPEGSLKVVTYIQENQPGEFVVRTADGDCVKVLRLVLPLFNYSIVDVTAGEVYVLKIRKKT